MERRLFVFSVISTLILGSLLLSPVFAQIQSGGVDKKGTWYLGEGLKQGDYFSYNVCHVDYKECTEFGLDIWFKGDVQVGSETKWLAEVVVYDGNKVVVGDMELGKIAPEPTGGSDELGVYRGAFKSSIVWLSAFATSDGSAGGKGPKDFSSPSWGKIGNIGGEQVIPIDVETVTIPSGTWEESIVIGWRTGGYESKVWIVDDFPFPIQAHTYTHVSEGIPPSEYRFALLEYKKDVQQSPFEGIVSTVDERLAQGCDTNIIKEASIKKPTINFDYQIHVFYGPEDPVQGCEIQWLIKFFNKFDDTEFLNQVQFDILTVDDDGKPTRSVAQEEGRKYLYSPSGQYTLDMIVREEVGETNYVIWIYGTSPEGLAPPTKYDYLNIPITIFANKHSAEPVQIPSWIKQTAGWWAAGDIDDDSFVQGIQFLIKEGIIQIPTAALENNGGGGNEIPAWVKQTAGWWAAGDIDDDSFVQGIQFLIKEGIINIS